MAVVTNLRLVFYCIVALFCSYKNIVSAQQATLCGAESCCQQCCSEANGFFSVSTCQNSCNFNINEGDCPAEPGFQRDSCLAGLNFRDPNKFAVEVQVGFYYSLLVPACCTVDLQGNGNFLIRDEAESACLIAPTEAPTLKPTANPTRSPVPQVTEEKLCDNGSCCAACCDAAKNFINEETCFAVCSGDLNEQDCQALPIGPREGCLAGLSYIDPRELFFLVDVGYGYGIFRPSCCIAENGGTLLVGNDLVDAACSIVPTAPSSTPTSGPSLPPTTPSPTVFEISTTSPTLSNDNENPEADSTLQLILGILVGIFAVSIIIGLVYLQKSKQKLNSINKEVEFVLDKPIQVGTQYFAPPYDTKRFGAL